jgi:hypothetical protein
MSTETQGCDARDLKPDVAPSGAAYRAIVMRHGRVTWSWHALRTTRLGSAEQHLQVRSCSPAAASGAHARP